MSQDQWTAVDDFVSGTLIPRDPVFENSLVRSAKSGLPDHHVSAPQGKLLHILARSHAARSILELGTLAGYSTIWLARALPAGGRLVTLEADPEYARVARANLDQIEQADAVQVVQGPALEMLPKLAAEGAGPFDLIFIDADKANNPNYLPLVLDLALPGALIVADNTVRAGALADQDSEDPKVQGQRRLHELIGADQRLDATTIQTVGEKGYDGFTIALLAG